MVAIVFNIKDVVHSHNLLGHDHESMNPQDHSHCEDGWRQELKAKEMYREKLLNSF